MVGTTGGEDGTVYLGVGDEVAHTDALATAVGDIHVGQHQPIDGRPASWSDRIDSGVLVDVLRGHERISEQITGVHRVFAETDSNGDAFQVYVESHAGSISCPRFAASNTSLFLGARRRHFL